MKTYKSEKKILEIDYRTFEIVKKDEHQPPPKFDFSIYFTSTFNSSNQCLRFLNLYELRTLHKLLGKVIKEEGGES